MVRGIEIERHFTGNLTVRDLVIGMSDGLTVPFALAAGLSAAVASTHIVLTGGLAEIAAGAISMGLGGYLAGKSDIDYYESERRREHRQLTQTTEYEAGQLDRLLAEFGISAEETSAIETALRRQPGAFVDFMMRLELGLDRPDRRRPIRSALTIAGAYVVGGIIPLAPYVFAPTPSSGLTYSAALTALALLVFGALKGRFTGIAPLQSAVQTVAVGAIAATAAFLIARAI